MTHDPTPPAAPLTDADLAAIEAALAAATPGEWRVQLADTAEAFYTIEAYDDEGLLIVAQLKDMWGPSEKGKEDAALIVLLRNNGAALVAALREARAEKDRLRAALGAAALDALFAGKNPLAALGNEEAYYDSESITPTPEMWQTWNEMVKRRWANPDELLTAADIDGGPIHLNGQPAIPIKRSDYDRLVQRIEAYSEARRAAGLTVIPADLSYYLIIEDAAAPGDEGGATLDKPEGED